MAYFTFSHFYQKLHIIGISTGKWKDFEISVIQNILGIFYTATILIHLYKMQLIFQTFFLLNLLFLGEVYNPNIT